VVVVHVRDVVTHVITLSSARGNKWVKLIVQLVHLLMQVVIVDLCIHNMPLKLNCRALKTFSTCQASFLYLST
jgi:hypothetical protein